MKKYAEVLVNQKIYTYSVPDNMHNDIRVGQQVTVPLRKKELSGFVIKFTDRPEFKTLDIISITDSKVCFQSELVELAQWISATYKCFPETALKAILPK